MAKESTSICTGLNLHMTTRDFPTQTSLLPPSRFYELRRVLHAGIGVFATLDIRKETQLLTTTESPTNGHDVSKEPLSPLVWLIQRPYRKEVCAECFLYDRGREWKVKVSGHTTSGYESQGKPSKDRDCGVVFCSDQCRDKWMHRNGEVGIQAWEVLEVGVKEMMKKSRSTNSGTTDRNCNSDQDQDDHNHRSLKGPSEDEVVQAWSEATMIGEVVINARKKRNPSKNERKVLRKVIEQGGDADLMYYILTAAMSAYSVGQTKVNDQREEVVNCPDQGLISEPTNTVSTSTSPPFLLASLTSLIPSSTAYAEQHTSIYLYSRSYLYLLTILPLSLLPYLTPQLCHEVNIRAAHNAFSIRPADGTDGSDSAEFLGWGVWPEASFWNHSCRPNLKKQRIGRQWRFSAAGQAEMIKKDEELCISYLGGEEETLNVVERRARLEGEWGFVCTCRRCVEEAGETP